MSDKQTIKDLTVYAPSEMSTEVERTRYVRTVVEQMLGKDKQGNLRPMADLVFFLQTCKATGLNPLSKQIYAIYRGNKLTIQSSIDGLRSIAEQSGLYAGSDAGVFKENENGIDSCTVTVYKLNKITGEKMPTSATAHWKEYFPTDSRMNTMWLKMPHTMISKCAEAKALRKAFPNTSQIYTEEEMHQADVVVQPKVEDKKIKADVNQAMKALGGADVGSEDKKKATGDKPKTASQKAFKKAKELKEKKNENHS